MKLNLGITAALAGCAAAASQSAAIVYMFPSSRDVSTDAPALPRSLARLILLQRLAPFGQGPSVTELPNDIDSEDAVGALNTFGKTVPSLFEDSSDGAPHQLVVMLENVSESHIKEVERMGKQYKISPSFTITNPPSSKAHDQLVQNDVYDAGVAHQHKCSIGQVINKNDAQCWSGKSTVARYDISKDVFVLKEVAQKIYKIKELAKSGEMETTILLLPFVEDSVESQQWSDVDHELRRRQAELPITHVEEEVDAVETSPATSHPAFVVSTGAIPSCFESLEKCETETRNCSSHGECRNKWADSEGKDGKNVCYSCHCLATQSEQGSVTHWGGQTCAKKDISFEFWLFAGFTLALVGILTVAIGMMFSVGEEKLPGVIGAGVSKTK